MYIKNIVGYDVSYKYRGNTITLPFDNQIYSVPDDLAIFEYCKVMPKTHKNVKYINIDGRVSHIFPGNKRRGGRKKLKRDKDKPLKGVCIDLEVRMRLELRYFGKSLISERALINHVRKKLSRTKDN